MGTEEDTEGIVHAAIEALKSCDCDRGRVKHGDTVCTRLSHIWETVLCKVPQLHTPAGEPLLKRSVWQQWCQAVARLASLNPLKRAQPPMRGVLACVLLECLRISAPKIPFDDETFQDVLQVCIQTLEDLRIPVTHQSGRPVTEGADGPEPCSASSGSVPTSQTGEVAEGHRWSLRVLELAAKTKVFVLAHACQVGSLVELLMSAASNITLSYRCKMQIAEIISSTLVEQAQETDPWTGSLDTITRVLDPVLTALNVQLPSVFLAATESQMLSEKPSSVHTWRFSARNIAEQIVQRASEVLKDPLVRYLRELPAEKRYSLIESLYFTAPGVLQGVLPDLSAESRARDTQTRLRCVQLIAKLFARHFSNISGSGTLFNDSNTVSRSLFLDLLERFQDVEAGVRAGTVCAVHELLIQLHRHVDQGALSMKDGPAESKVVTGTANPLVEQMLNELDRGLQDRMLDQDEQVRLAAVRTVLSSEHRAARLALRIVAHLPLASTTCLSRARDKRAAVRHTAIQGLSRLYRAFLRWHHEQVQNTASETIDERDSIPPKVHEWISQLVRELLASYIQLTQVGCAGNVPTDEMMGSIVQIEALFYDPRMSIADALSCWREALQDPHAQRINRSFGVHGWTAFPANDALRLMMRARAQFQRDMRALLDMRDEARQRCRLSERSFSDTAASLLDRLARSLGKPATVCNVEDQVCGVRLLLDVMLGRDERVFQNLRLLLHDPGSEYSTNSLPLIRDTVERLTRRSKAAAEWFQALVLLRMVPCLGRPSDVHMLVDIVLGQPEGANTASVECALLLEAASCYGGAFHEATLTRLVAAVPHQAALRVLSTLGPCLMNMGIECRHSLARCLETYLLGQVAEERSFRSLRCIKLAASVLATLWASDALTPSWERIVPQLESRSFEALKSGNYDECACALTTMAKIVRCAPNTVPVPTQIQILDVCLQLLTERPPDVGEPLTVASIIAACSILMSGFTALPGNASAQRSNAHGHSLGADAHDPAASSLQVRAGWSTAQGQQLASPERVDRFLHAVLLLVLQQGDWKALTRHSTSADELVSAPVPVSDAVLDSEPCARLRYYAAKSILKLARIRTIDQALLPAERHMVCLLMQDPIFEIRHDFALKLFRGLACGLLPWHWMAGLVLAAIDPERENVTNARWYLTALIRQRRQLVRSLEQQALATATEAAVSYLALMPECVLPYVLHLLAHHPDYLIDAQNAFADNRKYLSFILDTLLEHEQHVGILMQLLRLVSASEIPPPVPPLIGGGNGETHGRHRRSSMIVGEPIAQDLNLATQIMTERVHELALLCTDILKQKQAHKRWDLAEFPGPIRLPGPFFMTKRDVPFAETRQRSGDSPLRSAVALAP